MSSWSLCEPQDKKIVHGVKLAVPEMEKGAFLVITCSLVKQGSYTLVWVLQHGLGGSVNSSIPREKNPVVLCPFHLHCKHFISLELVLVLAWLLLA